MAALVYGLGGSLAISGQLRIGTLVAMATLITRLYGPINQLTNIQVNFLTALVSFDRVFEVLDLKPLIADRPAALALPTGKMSSGLAPEVEFDQVCFRYPSARDISLASLETIALPMPERTSDEWTLRNISFRVPSGKLTALVGPSGAGKTTIAHLVPRLYDPGSGTVRIGGHDIRDLTLRSVYETVGVADGLDTVAGDRGYRLSGGEKQRVALARLLLKAPPVVVLDEATAHLDSESELAIQQALKTALAGRTSLVIAHRLSTIREAEQILVVDAGEIRERGTHDKLLKTGGLYAELHRTQFTRRPASTEKPGRAPRR